MFPVTKIQWVVCYSGKFSEHGRRADFNSRLRTVVVYLDYETKGNLHTLPVLANELINHHITSHWGHRWTGKFVIFGGRSVPSENSSRHRSENNRRRPRSRKSRSKALGKSKRERSVPVLNGIRMGCNGATMVKGCLQTGYKIGVRVGEGGEALFRRLQMAGSPSCW